MSHAVEHHLRVTRTARYHTLGPLDEAVREVWYVLHGYRQLASRFLRHFRVLDDGARLIVAPEALSRFYIDPAPGRHGPEARVGGTWMTREDRLHEIADYVAYLDDLHRHLSQGREDARVVLLGFSQGLQTAARWATLGNVPAHHVILWGDYLPPDLDMRRAAERLRGARVTFVVGEKDTSRREHLESEQRQRLETWAIAHEVVQHDGGHELDGDVLRGVAGG